MIKQRILKGIAIMAAGSMLVTGCSTGTPIDGADTDKVKNGALLESETDSDNENGNGENGTSESGGSSNANAEEIQIIDNPNGDTAGTENGMYRIARTELPGGEFVSKIYYVDYATNQEIVLCNDASCKHDSTDCMGIINEDKLIDPSVFIYDDKLYVYQSASSTGWQWVSSELGEEAFSNLPAMLYQMNLDGTDRKKLAEWKDVDVADQVFAKDGNLYFLEKHMQTRKLESGEYYTDEASSKVVRLDTESGKKEEVTDFPLGYTALGTYKDSLVCQKTDFPEDYDESESNGMQHDEWKKYYMDSDEVITLINLENGSQKEITKIGNDELSSVTVHKDKLYISYENKKIKTIDLATGKKDKVKFPENKAVYLRESDGDYIKGNLEGDDWIEILWNPDTEEFYKTSYKIKGTDLPISILAETRDSYVIYYDGKTKQGLAEDSYDILSKKFGIISKDDFYHGNYNVKPIKMISNGLEDETEAETHD